jgi:hypothetical protein
VFHTELISFRRGGGEHMNIPYSQPQRQETLHITLYVTMLIDELSLFLRDDAHSQTHMHNELSLFAPSHKAHALVLVWAACSMTGSCHRPSPCASITNVAARCKRHTRDVRLGIVFLYVSLHLQAISTVCSEPLHTISRRACTRRACVGNAVIRR